MRQTAYTKTIHPQFKGQDKTIKQEQNKENIINGKILQKNGRGKPMCEVHIQSMWGSHAKKRVAHMQSAWDPHNSHFGTCQKGEACSGAYELRPLAKEYIGNTKSQSKFPNKISMKPKLNEKSKEKVEGMVAAVVESGRCCWVPKSNHNKENERKNKQWERREIHPSPLQGLNGKGLERN